MMTLPSHCAGCGTYLKGGLTEHEKTCPFYPLTTKGILAEREKAAIQKEPCAYCERPDQQSVCAGCHGNPDGHEEDGGPCKECSGHGFYTDCTCKAARFDHRAAWEAGE